jgi:hypothetical protein
MQANVNKFVSALNTFAAASNNATRSLREAAVAAGFTTLEECKPVVLQWASVRHGVPLVKSESNVNKGALVLDRSHRSFEAAKKSAQRALEALKGDADAPATSTKGEKKEGVEVPADIAALAAKLVALCNEYEGAKKLAAQAVADAFAALKAK